MKRYLTILFALAVSVQVARAQFMTHTKMHDAAKMNQINVMEMGIGYLTPEFWYTITHPNYRHTAAITNKLTHRSSAGAASQDQVGMAEEVDSALTDRAKAEALNVADRSGGIADVAWLSEGKKVESALEAYRKGVETLDRLSLPAAVKKYWAEQYDKFCCAIEETRSAYMPNSKRQKQYLGVYQDICKEREYLTRFILAKKLSDLNDWSNTATLPSIDFGSIASTALEQWKGNAAALSMAGSQKDEEENSNQN